MPYADNTVNMLARLGKELKTLRLKSEQFCVFAFDLHDFDNLQPIGAASVNRESLPFLYGGNSYPDEGVPNWNAAFYQEVAPAHTEKAILESLLQWMSDYEGTYGAADTLYIYSFLIPCFRDCGNGLCSENIAALILFIHQKINPNLKFRIGWSNDDRDSDMAVAIKAGLTDLDDDGVDIELFAGASRGLSIAG